MEHQKIFTRPDKSSVMITVHVSVDDTWRNEHNWSFSVQTRQYRGKKWYQVFSGSDYHYRAIKSNEQRARYRNAELLKVVTPEEVLEVQLELWYKIKPTQLLNPTF